MDIRKTLYLIFFLLITSVSAQQSDSVFHHRLTDIVISATKTKNSTMYLANSISVIDSAEISRRGKITLLDLLKSEYGLSYTSQGNPGALSFVNIRGANTGHTLVLIDGIEMNMPTDPGGTFDFSTVTTENIERIEILRGPQSTLYGGDALAGVINIFTRKGDKGLRLNLSSEGGSYNTYRGNAAISGGTGMFSFNVNYGRVTSDGYSSAAEKFGNTEKDGFRNSTISARGGIQITPDMNFDLRYHFTKAGADLDRFAGLGGDDPTYTSGIEESGLRASLDVNTFSFLEQTFGASFNRNFRKYKFDKTPVHPGASTSRYDGNKVKFDWQNNIYIPYQVLTAGFEFEEEKTSSEYYEDGLWGPYESIFPQASNNTYAVYLQDQLKTGNSFFFTSGLRFDNNKSFGSKVTYRVAPAYLFGSGTKIKATYGTGYKSPSLFYLFDPMYGSRDLKPEESRGWDAGVEQYFTGLLLSAGITYFNMQFDQMFGFNPLTYRTININKASTEGIEFFINSELYRDLRVKANYTFTQVKDKSDGSGSSVLMRRPKHKASLTADFSFAKFANAGVELLYVGDRNDIYYSGAWDEAPQVVVMDQYTIINMNFSYELFEKVKLFTRLENLLNTEYEEIYGFGTPGFSVFAGVKIDTKNILN